jgi:hypothetical protein
MHMPIVRNRRWWLLAVIAVTLVTVLYAAGCFKREVWYADVGPAPAGFETLPGKLGVRFKSWSDGQWHFKNLLYRDGQVQMADTLPPTNENAKTGGGEQRASWLPDIRGVPYDGPYAKTVDGRFLVAGVSHGGTYYSITDLLIVDMATSNVIATLDTGDQWGILGVAWSPDGQFVSIIKVVSEFQFCLLGAVSYWVGHPVRLYTLSLIVIDRKGNIVADAPLFANSDRWGAEVVWQ